jgi:hypothetical protein
MADSDYQRMVRRVAAERGLSFLQKPFTMNTLANKVRQVLDAPIAAAMGAAG